MEKNGITITVAAPDEVKAADSVGRIQKYGIGKKYRGKVVNFKPYGIFVETEDGGFGLAHGRNIRGWDWTQRFDRVFKHGSEIEVTVVDVEPETNRMSFSCEMPVQAIEETKQEEEELPPSRQDVVKKWVEENSKKSAEAYEWLKAELADGPMYGPLTNVLCDRFGVPIPVSQWIRLFGDFTCYSGKGDNPCDLPAVALSARAGEVGYWDGIKVRTDDLLEFRDRSLDEEAKLGRIAKRLDAKGVFPGAEWIAEYVKTANGLSKGRGVYGVSDTVERLVIPMLGQLGWNVSPSNAALVRGGNGTFDIRIFGGAASSGDVSIAVECAPAGTGFASAVGVVEQVLGLYNRLGGSDPLSAKVLWTDGIEWVVFTRELLSQCIGILAEHRGEKLQAEFGEENFRRVKLPLEGTPFAWLESFADLLEMAGK